MLTLNTITIINIFLLSGVLFFRKNNVLPNKILALIVLNPTLNFIGNVFILLELNHHVPYLIFFTQCTAYLFAPLVFVYTQLFMGKKNRFKHYLHIATSLLILLTLYFGVEFYFMSAEEQHFYLEGLRNENYPWQIDLTNYIFILLQQAYFTTAAIQIFRYSKKVKDYHSNPDKIKLSYLQLFITLIWILNFVTIICYGTLPTTYVEYIVLPVVLHIIYLFIVYFGFQHHAIFNTEDYDQFVHETNEISLQEENKKETAIPENLQLIANKIKTAIDCDKVYTQHDLTISKLAAYIEHPSHQVSQAINSIFNTNFNELINTERTKAAVQILENNPLNLTMEGICYEVGFNSRPSFYRAFKKHTQYTPTEYLQLTNNKKPSI